MIKAFLAAVATALLTGGVLLAPTKAEAGHRYEGGHQAARCKAAYHAGLQHRPHTPCFRRHTAGFSFARGATTPFYAGITDQYDGARRRGHQRDSKRHYQHDRHAIKISK
jgi:hypothetical protein